MGHELVQQRKLAFACARAEFIKVGKILRRLLHNLKKFEHENEHALVQGHIGQLSSKLSFLQDRHGKSSLITHGWHNANTIRFGSVSGVRRLERFGDTSVEHELFGTQFGSDVL